MNEEQNHLKHRIREKQIKNEKKEEKGGIMSEEKGGIMSKTKLVIEEREDGVLIGVSREGVDPFVKKMDLTLPQMLDQMPFVKGIVGFAEEQWAVAPKNPPYVKPEAPKTEPKKEPKKPREKKLAPGVLTPGQSAMPVDIPNRVSTELPALMKDDSEDVAPASEEATKPPEKKVEPSEQLPTKVEPEPSTPVDNPVTLATGGTLHDAKTLLDNAGIFEPVEQASTATVGPPAPETESKRVRVSADNFQYRLKDGSGPFATIQEALDAINFDKVNRPLHNRYDRLSKKLQEEIKQETKK
jgi:hypothetical protein